MKKVKLELVGLDGNAFSIMGAFRKQARRESWTTEEIKVVLDEAMSGDYNHLLTTIMEHTESPESDDEDDFSDELDDYSPEEFESFDEKIVGDD
jgi:hypothetical protein